jgi:eukaryotic-like serine/threonine-protein kinase
VSAGANIPSEVGDGRYRVHEPLGSGSMGTVYGATGPGGEAVAVKILHEHLTGAPDVVARFRREAKLAAKITSPFVAPVLGAGRSPQGLYWIAYQRLHGETLEACLAREGAMDPQRAAVVVDHVLRGLGAAHAVGIVHRDIKPANIFLQAVDGGSRACVLDFGSSKYAPPPDAAASQPLTTAHTPLGTVSYMPPEQFGGASTVDARADLYAAGVVAFEVLTGGLPFVGATRGAVLLAKRQGAARTLAEASVGRAWGAGMEGFFLMALAREVPGRFADAEAMRRAWATEGRNK